MNEFEFITREEMITALRAVEMTFNKATLDSRRPRRSRQMCVVVCVAIKRVANMIEFGVERPAGKQ